MTVFIALSAPSKWIWRYNLNRVWNVNGENEAVVENGHSISSEDLLQFIYMNSMF